MEKTGCAEAIIETEIGCGLFQVFIVIFLFTFIKITSLFTFMFMSFGNYDPGWRCLDNQTLPQIYSNISLPNQETLVNTSIDSYSKQVGKCEAFEACERIEFNPESSTIVTEFGLVCSRAYISPLIISFQMAGNLVGSFISGQVADTFGRKKTLYGSLLINIVLTIGSIFSVSWEMFASFRFLIGFVSSFFESLNFVYPAEFLSRKWRGPMMGVPGWAVGGVIFGCLCMFFKNWKHVLVASSVVFAVSFIPVLWVPESLRWLEVKNKIKDFDKATRKMAKLNGKTLSKSFRLNEGNVQHALTASKLEEKNIELPKYSVKDLFRSEYRCISVIIAISWMLLSIVFFSVSFGVKALSGNFYINLIIVYTIFIPFIVFPLFGTNIFGRKRASCIFIITSGVCSFAAMVSELVASGNAKVISILVFVIFGLICTETAWTSQQVHLTELYPTVVRGLAMNWANVMCRIGGIIAPFLIPRDSDDVYVWYLIMGCLAMVTCCLFTKLPETKGKPLKDTFEKIDVNIVVNGVHDENLEQSQTESKETINPL